MDGVLEQGETTRFRERLMYLAWRRYRIPQQAAEDLVQSALLTYLEVRNRYPNEQEHPRILVGIFRNKCREYIDGRVRAGRRLRALLSSVAAGSPEVRAAPVEAATDDGILDELAHREATELILETLTELRPKAREMFLVILEEGASRKDLIRRFGLNKNTLDSRLHTYRREFRELLARRGFDL